MATLQNEGYQTLSYIQLAETLQTLVATGSGSDATQLIVQHYVDMLRKNIVEDEQLKSMAAKLYERHTEALDFIFANRPRRVGLVDVIAQEVRACEGLSIDSEGGTTMRFSVDQWDACNLFRIDLKDWSKTGRGLLFEVKSYVAKPGRLNVSLIIGPGDQAYRKALHEAAKARPKQFVGLTKSIGEKWVTIFSRDLLTAERAANMSSDAQINNLRLAWSDFQGTVLPRLIDTVLELDAAIAAAPSLGRGDQVDINTPK
jgi:hypothetical protein